MEFRIVRSELADAVAWAARVLPARSPVPVLGGLLLEADSGRLRISGLDYEAAARIEIDADVVRPGRVLEAADVASQRLPSTLEGASEMTVAFNPSFLVDALSSFDAPVVRFDLLGPGQRALLTGLASADDTDRNPAHRHLLMAVKPLV